MSSNSLGRLAWIASLGLLGCGGTNEGAFGPPIAIGTEGVDQGAGARVEADRDGNFLAVWHQGGHVEAARFPTTGSFTTQIVSTPTVVGFPDLAIDASGHAVAAYGSGYDLRSASFAPATGWAADAKLVTTSAMPDFVGVELDDAGDGFLVASASDGNHYDVRVRRYLAGQGFAATDAVIDTTTAYDARSPVLRVNSAGDALLAWAQSDGTHVDLYVSLYAKSSDAWSPPQLLDGDVMAVPPVANWFVRMDVDLDDRGEGIVAWTEETATGYAVMARRVASGGWSPIEAIDPASNAFESTRASIDAAGRAIVTWHVDDGTKVRTRARRFANGAWGGVADLGDPDSAFTMDVSRVAFDASGNGTVAWTAVGSGAGAIRTIWSARYPARGGWQTPVRVSDGAADANYADVAAAPDGRARVVWTQGAWQLETLWSATFE